MIFFRKKKKCQNEPSMRMTKKRKKSSKNSQLKFELYCIEEKKRKMSFDIFYFNLLRMACRFIGQLII